MIQTSRAAVMAGQGQRQPGRRRLGRAAHGHDRALLVQRGQAGEERGHVRVRADAQQQHVEGRHAAAILRLRRRRAASSRTARRQPPGPAPSGPSGPGIGCTRSGLTSTWSSSASRAPVSLRSGSPVGRNRSSPHQISSRRQSTASLAGAAASSASTWVPTPPPVSTSEAMPRGRDGVDQPGHQPGGNRLGEQLAVAVDQQLWACDGRYPLPPRRPRRSTASVSP